MNKYIIAGEAIDLEYFKIEEFDDPFIPHSGENMKPKLLLMLDKLRKMCGFAFVVSSGFRSPVHNEEVGGKEDSAHLTGEAVDVLCNSQQAYIIVKNALELGFTGIGISQKGAGQRFVHLDIREKAPRPNIWSY